MFFLAADVDITEKHFLQRLSEEAGKEPCSILLRTSHGVHDIILRIERATDIRQWQVISLVTPKHKPRQIIILDSEIDAKKLAERICRHLVCSPNTTDSKSIVEDVQRWMLLGGPTVMFTKHLNSVMLKKTNKSNAVELTEGTGTDAPLNDWWTIPISQPASSGRLRDFLLKWEGQAYFGRKKAIFPFDLVTVKEPEQAFHIAIEHNDRKLADQIVESIGNDYYMYTVVKTVVYAGILTSLLADVIKKLEPYLQVDLLKQALLRDRLNVLEFYIKNDVSLSYLTDETDDDSRLNGVQLALFEKLNSLTPARLPETIAFFDNIMGLLDGQKTERRKIASKLLLYSAHFPRLFEILLKYSELSLSQLTEVRDVLYTANAPGEIIIMVDRAIAKRRSPSREWGAMGA